MPWLDAPPHRLSELPVSDRPVLVGESALRVAGELGGSPCEISLRLQGQHLRLEVEGVALCEVESDTLTLRERPRVEDDRLLQALLGPGAMLLLATRGIVALHASAVERDGRALLFVGESGVGKSTLAAHLAERGWDWVADDIVPLARTGAGLRALPGFPQLRLSPAEQYRGAVELELAGVYELGRADSVSLTRCEMRTALLAGVRHTVAARLFPTPLLDWHLAWMGGAIRETAFHRLRYPKRPVALDAVEEELERSLTG